MSPEPASTLTLRSATADDAALVVEFIHALAEYEQLSCECTATEEQVRATLLSPSSNAECILAFSDGVPAGFAVFFSNYSTFLARPGIYLEDLFVKPAYRQRGIGKGLILHLAKLANERGCGRLEWSVLEWNTPAIEFYKGIGATILPDWRVCRLTGEALSRYA